MASTYASASASYAPKRLLGIRSNPPYSSKQDSNPFGASMADSIFDTYDYDSEPCEEVSDYQYPVSTDEEYWYQTELPLENVRQLEERMRRQIARFERCYKKMMISALKWHYLQEEVDENPQVEKMFNDMQMVRKLSGSDRV